jgi:hypothetical protein
VGLTPDPEALAAALLQLSEHAGQLTTLDARQARHEAEISERITALTTLAHAMRSTLDDQAAILAGLTSLSEQVTTLARRLDDASPDPGSDPAGYQPSLPPRFWNLDGQARADAISRLRAWVDQVYRPGYGQLAAQLSDCWEQHPLCLYTLDWLSELWSVLYLQPRRTPATLAGQAEWQTRLLAAAADQMARETARCPHTVTRAPRPPWPGTRP